MDHLAMEGASAAYSVQMVNMQGQLCNWSACGATGALRTWPAPDRPNVTAVSGRVAIAQQRREHAPGLTRPGRARPRCGAAAGELALWHPAHARSQFRLHLPNMRSTLCVGDSNKLLRCKVFYFGLAAIAAGAASVA